MAKAMHILCFAHIQTYKNNFFSTIPSKCIGVQKKKLYVFKGMH